MNEIRFETTAQGHGTVIAAEAGMSDEKKVVAARRLWIPFRAFPFCRWPTSVPCPSASAAILEKGLLTGDVRADGIAAACVSCSVPALR